MPKPHPLVDELFNCLINGDRPAAHQLAAQALASGLPPAGLMAEVYWPTYEQIDGLFRRDQLTAIAHNLATRLLRTLVDQVQAQYPQKPRIGRTVFSFCGPTEPDELGAQMAIDLLEAEGFEVKFAGGGIAGDEILALVHELRPDVLLLFASAPCDLPEIRHLIDMLEEIGACRKTQIVVGGGVFNRAAGLAEEIGADLWATDPLDLVDAMLECPDAKATPDQRTVGKRRGKAA